MTATQSAGRPRLESIDLVRGVIMVVMALDHTRDFFGVPGVSPTNLAAATPALFLTRWITNFCAPVFFLLAGTGARLMLGRRSVGELSRFLALRGLWLIVLETVVIRCLVYQFNVDFRTTMLLVLWALGWSMIVLAGLVRLPMTVIAAIGVVLIAGHNVFDTLRVRSALWSILHVPSVVLNTPGHVVFVSYPLVPWIGVTAIGFVLGSVYTWPPQQRRSLLFRTGVSLSAAFVVLRWLNVYGDAARWAHLASPLLTALSFLNTTKYPPSLLFLLMTLGPALVLLWAADFGTARAFKPAVVIGRVPLFYYAAHFFSIHLLAVVVCLLRYGTAHWMFESPDLGHYPFTPPPGWGYTLPAVYALWIAIVVAMYPMCRWFGELKQRRREAWLSYL